MGLYYATSISGNWTIRNIVFTYRGRLMNRHHFQIISKKKLMLFTK